MSLLRRCWKELIDLFVDDGATAALVALWIAASCLILPRLSLGIWSGPVLFAGLAGLFAAGLLRREKTARR